MTEVVRQATSLESGLGRAGSWVLIVELETSWAVGDPSILEALLARST